MRATLPPIMQRTTPCVLLAMLLALGIATACDRNIGPVVPGEQPREPDLGRIFPANAGEPAAPPMGAQPPAAATPAGAAGGATISGTISVAPELAGSVPAGAILFLVARPAGSRGGPPLAVQRMNATGFPLAFEIGPKDVMIPSMQFTGEIGLSARIDSDGNAMSREPGDLQGSSDGTRSPGDTGVAIVIDERL